MTTVQQELPILLDSHQVGELLGVSRRKFWDLVKQEGFPKPRKLGERSQRWLRREVEAWVAELPPEGIEEPGPLAAARQARNAGQPTAAAPFPPGPAKRAWTHYGTEPTT